MVHRLYEHIIPGQLLVKMREIVQGEVSMHDTC